MKYSNERREAVLKKVLPPNNQTIVEVADAEGIAVATLYQWRKEARGTGRLFLGQASDPASWRSAEKLNAVVETAVSTSA